MVHFVERGTIQHATARRSTCTTSHYFDVLSVAGNRRTLATSTCLFFLHSGGKVGLMSQPGQYVDHLQHNFATPVNDRSSAHRCSPENNKEQRDENHESNEARIIDFFAACPSYERKRTETLVMIQTDDTKRASPDSNKSSGQLMCSWKPLSGCAFWPVFFSVHDRRTK